MVVAVGGVGDFDPALGIAANLAERDGPVSHRSGIVHAAYRVHGMTRSPASSPSQSAPQTRTRSERLEIINADVVACRRCPRLVDWCQQVAIDKRAAFRNDVYWGRPVPSFGDPTARIVVLGLAPAAHGANRTGRMFTGDRSGDWLFRSMHDAGLCNQPTSSGRDDGLTLDDVWVTATAHCAPPANKPTPQERQNCSSFLAAELDVLQPNVIVCLGAMGWNAALDHFGIRPRPKFGHGVEFEPFPDRTSEQRLVLLGSFHPSQQNTFTKRLTKPMLDSVFERAVKLAGRSHDGSR